MSSKWLSGITFVLFLVVHIVLCVPLLTPSRHPLTRKKGDSSTENAPPQIDGDNSTENAPPQINDDNSKEKAPSQFFYHERSLSTWLCELGLFCSTSDAPQRQPSKLKEDVDRTDTTNGAISRAPSKSSEEKHRTDKKNGAISRAPSKSSEEKHRTNKKNGAISRAPSQLNGDKHRKGTKNVRLNVNIPSLRSQKLFSFAPDLRDYLCRLQLLCL